MLTLWRDDASARTMPADLSPPFAAKGAAVVRDRPHARELYATLLGPFSLFRCGQLVPLGPRGAVAELSRYLVAHAGTPVPRDELIELLWPEADPYRAVHRLHVAVSKLRGAVASRGAGKSPVRLADDQYSIEAESILTDCDLFETQYREAKRLGGCHEYAAAAGLFRAALAGYSGDYVADRPYAEWTVQKRAHFSERRLDAMTWLCEHALRSNDLGALADYAQAILDTDNLRERIHRYLMRVHYARGERGRAIRQYQRCADALQTELGVRPSRETDHLYHAILEDVALPDESYSYA